jgi:hypothetical protein
VPATAFPGDTLDDFEKDAFCLTPARRVKSINHEEAGFFPAPGSEGIDQVELEI